MWTHNDYPETKFDADTKKGDKKPFRLESVGAGKKIRKSFTSWQAAKKAGWVKTKK